MMNRIRFQAALTAATAAVVVVLAASAAVPRAARADEAYTFIVKKQEAKAAHRWSLQEWLDTRDRMRMMDLWLALHSPSPYEFFFGAAYQLGTQSGGSTYSSPSFAAAAYVTIFGLELERESGLDTRYDATFHLRFFGLHYQATHVRAEVGLRHESVGPNLSFQNALAGVGLTIYLAKPFGIEGRWRHAFSSTPNASGVEFGGDRYEGGAFLDFSFVRVYGQYVYEKLSTDPSSLAADTVRSGPQAGMKLFF
jgi:hypothetical protein